MRTISSCCYEWLVHCWLKSFFSVGFLRPFRKLMLLQFLLRSSEKQFSSFISLYGWRSFSERLQNIFGSECIIFQKLDSRDSRRIGVVSFRRLTRTITLISPMTLKFSSLISSLTAISTPLSLLLWMQGSLQFLFPKLVSRIVCSHRFLWRDLQCNSTSEINFKNPIAHNFSVGMVNVNQVSSSRNVILLPFCIFRWEFRI